MLFNNGSTCSATARLMEPDAIAAVAAVMEPKKTPAPSVALLEALLRLLSKSPRWDCAQVTRSSKAPGDPTLEPIK